MQITWELQHTIVSFFFTEYNDDTLMHQLSARSSSYRHQVILKPAESPRPLIRMTVVASY
jgi:hypothetical protein